MTSETIKVLGGLMLAATISLPALAASTKTCGWELDSSNTIRFSGCVPAEVRVLQPGIGDEAGDWSSVEVHRPADWGWETERVSYGFGQAGSAATLCAPTVRGTVAQDGQLVLYAYPETREYLCVMEDDDGNHCSFHTVPSTGKYVCDRSEINVRNYVGGNEGDPIELKFTAIDGPEPVVVENSTLMRPVEGSMSGRKAGEITQSGLISYHHESIGRLTVGADGLPLITSDPKLQLETAARISILPREMPPSRTVLILERTDTGRPAWGDTYYELVWDPLLGHRLGRYLVLHPGTWQISLYSESHYAPTVSQDQNSLTDGRVLTPGWRFKEAAFSGGSGVLTVEDPARLVPSKKKALYAKGSSLEFPGGPDHDKSPKEVAAVSIRFRSQPPPKLATASRGLRIASAAEGGGAYRSLGGEVPDEVIEAFEILAEIAMEQSQDRAFDFLSERIALLLCDDLIVSRLPEDVRGSLGFEETDAPVFPETCSAVSAIRMEDIGMAGEAVYLALMADMNAIALRAVLHHFEGEIDEDRWNQLELRLRPIVAHLQSMTADVVTGGAISSNAAEQLVVELSRQDWAGLAEDDGPPEARAAMCGVQLAFAAVATCMESGDCSAEQLTYLLEHADAAFDLTDDDGWVCGDLFTKFSDSSNTSQLKYFWPDIEQFTARILTVVTQDPGATPDRFARDVVGLSLDLVSMILRWEYLARGDDALAAAQDAIDAFRGAEMGKKYEPNLEAAEKSLTSAQKCMDTWKKPRWESMKDVCSAEKARGDLRDVLDRLLVASAELNEWASRTPQNGEGKDKPNAKKIEKAKEVQKQFRIFYGQFGPILYFDDYIDDTRQVVDAVFDQDVASAIIATTSLLETAIRQHTDHALTEQTVDQARFVGSAQKASAIMTALVSYASTYEDADGDGNEDSAELAEQQRAARKASIESLVRASTSRRNRDGEVVVSVGANVGFSLAAGRARINPAGSGPGSWSERLQVQTTDTATAPSQQFVPPSLSLPMGVAIQWLPDSRKVTARQRARGLKVRSLQGIAVGGHLQGSFVDLGNFLSWGIEDPGSDDESTERTAIRWDQMFFAGIQGGIIIGTPSAPFTIVADIRYVPGLFPTDAADEDDKLIDNPAGAFQVGVSVGFYVPFFDFN